MCYMLPYIKQPISACLQVQMKFLCWDDTVAKTGFRVCSFAIKLNQNAFSTCILVLGLNHIWCGMIRQHKMVLVYCKYRRYFLFYTGLPVQNFLCIILYYTRCIISIIRIIGIKHYYDYQIMSFELAHFESLSDHFDGTELVSGACLDVELVGAGDSMNRARSFGVDKSTRSSIWRRSMDVRVMVGESPSSESSSSSSSRAWAP